MLTLACTSCVWHPFATFCWLALLISSLFWHATPPFGSHEFPCRLYQAGIQNVLFECFACMCRCICNVSVYIFIRNFFADICLCLCKCTCPCDMLCAMSIWHMHDIERMILHDMIDMHVVNMYVSVYMCVKCPQWTSILNGVVSKLLQAGQWFHGINLQVDGSCKMWGCVAHVCNRSWLSAVEYIAPFCSSFPSPARYSVSFQMQKKLSWFLWAVSHGIETTAGKSMEDGMVWMNWMTVSSLLNFTAVFCYNRRQLEMLSISKVSEATQNSDLLCSKCFQLRRLNNSGFSRNYGCFAPWPDNRRLLVLRPPRCSFMDGSLVKKDWLNVLRFRETTFSLFCCIVGFSKFTSLSCTPVPLPSL